MNTKIRNAIFFLMVFSFIFNNIPRPVQLSFIGGPVSAKLLIYPLLAALGYSLWCQYKYKNVFVDIRPFARYIAVFVGIMLLSVIVGLCNFPYYNQVLSGPVNQIEKLPKMLAFCQAHGLAVDGRLIVQAWVAARAFKIVLLEAFWCFGGAYIVYCWYKDEWQQAVELVMRAVLASSIVVILYSVVEVAWLAHSEAAEPLLRTINPYIHSIEIDGKWWPPLLWPAQLRSVFSEPSYYGIYMAFALPWLWQRIYQRQGKVYLIVTFLLSFGLILTRARTTFMLYVGELALLALFCLLWERNKSSLLAFSKVIVISLCAFLVGVGFVSQCADSKLTGGAFTNQSEEANVKESDNVLLAYIESNVVSLFYSDARSNRARYSVMEADIKIGLDHPVLGVGKELRNGYLPDYFSEKALQDNEVKMWLSFREKLGIMRSGFPMLGEYTSRFSESGLLGLGIFFVPIIVLLRALYRRLQQDSNRLPYIMFAVSFCGSLAAGIGDTLHTLDCYYLLLGLGYAIALGTPVKASEDTKEAA